MSFTLDITIENFEDKLYGEVARHFTNAMRRAKPEIEAGLRVMIDTNIRSSPESVGLLNPTRFLGEIGVDNASEAIDKIIKAINESLEVKVNPITYSSKKFSGGISVGIIKSDFSEVLGLDIASFISENDFDVHWLKWLLTEGQNIVVREYHFVGLSTKSKRNYASILGNSRTEQGIMAPGGNWRVPAPGGTIEDNFLTRSLDNIEPELLVLFEKSIGANL